jgi:hypothetical protein
MARRKKTRHEAVSLAVSARDVQRALPRGGAEMTGTSVFVNRLCTYPAHELKKSDILRVATASDAAALLDEMDSVMRQREHAAAEENIAPASGPETKMR